MIYETVLYHRTAGGIPVCTAAPITDITIFKYKTCEKNQQVTSLPLRNCNVPNTNAQILLKLKCFKIRKRVNKIN